MQGKAASRLRYLTIKPTDFCGYSCPYCSGRQSLFKKTKGISLSLLEWRTILKDANNLGVECIRISGGEPTLFRELPQLVEIARDYSDHVLIYSNGFLLTAYLAENLKKKGLEGVSISLMSLDSELHDRLRQTSGSNESAINACQNIVMAGLHLSIHIIICRHNYREIPELIRYAIKIGARAIELHYPENDIQHRYLLMNTEDIRCWREDVLPRCIATMKEFNLLHKIDLGALKSMYSQHCREANHSAGVYWPSLEAAIRNCSKPVSFAMVYPNGDVLPCNGVEYAHDPIIGNLREKSLCDLWKGRIFDQFRINRTSWCKFCPMVLHTVLKLK
jgi:PqqA peptide cyclase